MKGFLNFIRQQGVIGLAIGFILGGAVSKVVSALVEDIINPLIGFILSKTAGNLADITLTMGSVELRYGSFITAIIDFMVVAGVVYFGFKGLRIEKWDKKKK